MNEIRRSWIHQKRSITKKAPLEVTNHVCLLPDGIHFSRFFFGATIDLSSDQELFQIHP